MEKLYWFYIIDGRNGKSEEGEQMIRSFIGKGHKFDNLFIFTSEVPIDDIHAFLKEHKMKDFMYLLVDMTNNVTPETFKVLVNEEYYRPTEKFLKLLKSYIPEEKKELPINFQKQADEILDIISKNGLKALNPQQKQFIDDFSKGKYDKKSNN